LKQAGYVHELDPKTGKTHIVNITDRSTFPWIDAALGYVTSRMSNLSISPYRRCVFLVKARGEIHHPLEKGDARDLSKSSEWPNAIPPGLRMQVHLLFQRYRANTNWWSKPRRNHAARARSRLPHPTTNYTPSLVARFEKNCSTPTPNLKVWVLDVASGQAKIVGEDP